MNRQASRLKNSFSDAEISRERGRGESLYCSVVLHINIAWEDAPFCLYVLHTPPTCARRAVVARQTVLSVSNNVWDRKLLTGSWTAKVHSP